MNDLKKKLSLSSRMFVTLNELYKASQTCALEKALEVFGDRLVDGIICILNSILSDTGQAFPASAEKRKGSSQPLTRLLMHPPLKSLGVSGLHRQKAAAERAFARLRVAKN